MKLKHALITAIIVTLIATVCWELYWRSNNYYPTLNDEKALWALERSKVEKATNEDVIILGSSRAYFDIQQDAFNKIMGRYPIQLASTGSSPLPTFHDIVNNTSFTGTIIVGIAPGLFFSTVYPGASPWRRAQSKVDYYQDQTYAQKMNFRLSIPLQKNLAFMSADEEEWSDDIDLKSLLRRINIGNRTEQPPMPPFYSFGDVSIPRNMRMTDRTVQDTAFANTVKRVWYFFGSDAPAPDKKSTMAYFMDDYKKFTARGGQVILMRCPSSGGVRMGENMGLPRSGFWDDLVKQTGAPSYHFEDYDELKGLICPEDSHLSGTDADYYTTTLLNLLIQDGVLKKNKSEYALK
ncbi:hypothetical protein [Gaetbulibacter aestuarii]|uniref:SGNH/GDSL hydrolase family protein n=1 Tax=Gaetbulibacter aestuarii TaxID=1502358 RepID=A0ABW7MY67_9FLAO